MEKIKKFISKRTDSNTSSKYKRRLRHSRSMPLKGGAFDMTDWEIDPIHNSPPTTQVGRSTEDIRTSNDTAVASLDIGYANNLSDKASFSPVAPSDSEKAYDRPFRDSNDYAVEARAYFADMQRKQEEAQQEMADLLSRVGQDVQLRKLEEERRKKHARDLAFSRLEQRTRRPKWSDYEDHIEVIYDRNGQFLRYAAKQQIKPSAHDSHSRKITWHMNASCDNLSSMAPISKPRCGVPQLKVVNRDPAKDAF